jgi:hypothetical protein
VDEGITVPVVTRGVIGLGCTAVLLAACSSGTTGSTTTPPSPTAPSPVAASATAAASAAASPVGDWIGDPVARALLPDKEAVSKVVGSTVAKDPSVATYTSKDLVVSAKVDPASCTDVYGLVWALTMPQQTPALTAAAYTVGNSALVIDIGQSAMSLDDILSAVDACRTFSVVKTHGAATYAVGDSVSTFTIDRAVTTAPDALTIGLTSQSQILLSTDEKCTSGASPSPECVQLRVDNVNQELRTSGANLVSVWGVSTVSVNGQASTDPQIGQPAVTALANGMQRAVARNS